MIEEAEEAKSDFVGGCFDAGLWESGGALLEGKFKQWTSLTDYGRVEVVNGGNCAIGSDDHERRMARRVVL